MSSSPAEWFVGTSSRLLVTIGESWTWGDSLGERRLQSVFGRQLADMLSADWCNIAKCGESNLWIATQLENLTVPEHYKQVDIVLTMTELGREFNGDLDHDRVYTDLLQDIKTFDEFLDRLSELISQKLRPLKQKYRIWIGTNFIDSNYPKDLQVLPLSWLDLIAKETQQIKNQERCLVVGSWVYERFDAVFDFCPTIDRGSWRLSLIEHMSRAQQTTELLRLSPLNYKKASMHPTHAGHTLWAQYLYKAITS